MDTLSQNCHSTGTQWGTRPKLFPVNLFLYCASALLPVIYVLYLTIMFPYHASMVYFFFPWCTFFKFIPFFQVHSTLTLVNLSVSTVYLPYVYRPHCFEYYLFHVNISVCCPMFHMLRHYHSILNCFVSIFALYFYVGHGSMLYCPCHTYLSMPCML